MPYNASPRPVVAASNEEESVDTARCNSENMQIALNNISSAMHNQIGVFLKGDDKHPYRFD